VENAFLINFFLAEYFENFNEDNDDNSPEQTIGLLKLAASITSSWRVRPRSVVYFQADRCLQGGCRRIQPNARSASWVVWGFTGF
jgi:hypothetical protein